MEFHADHRPPTICPHPGIGVDGRFLVSAGARGDQGTGRSAGDFVARGHAGIVLAAGGSLRLGEPKQLLRINGQSLLRRAVLLLLETRPREVLVVVGAESGRMCAELVDLPVSIVVNDEWETGLASSLKAAAAAVRREADAAFLTLGVDQPRLDARHLHELLLASREWPGHDVLSGYGGIAGIPALLQGATLALAAMLEGDRGLQAVLEHRPNRVVENPGLIEDLDTPDAVARARRQGWID